jgi:hypothetical protein
MGRVTAFIMLLLVPRLADAAVPAKLGKAAVQAKLKAIAAKNVNAVNQLHFDQPAWRHYTDLVTRPDADHDYPGVFAAVKDFRAAKNLWAGVWMGLKSEQAELKAQVPAYRFLLRRQIDSTFKALRIETALQLRNWNNSEAAFKSQNVRDDADWRNAAWSVINTHLMNEPELTAQEGNRKYGMGKVWFKWGNSVWEEIDNPSQHLYGEDGTRK